MSSNENSPPQSPTARRASFAPGQRLSQLFSRSPGNVGTGPYPGPIAAAAASAHASQPRRMSISTLGLSGSPTQTSPFGGLRARQDSSSSSTGSPGGVDESAVEDSDAVTPTTPFARRMSFGAKALRDVRVGGSTFNGEGFNWSEQLRSRAQRSSSITSPPPPPAPAVVPVREHQRAASTTQMEAPVKEIPKQPKVPDHFQERILKGDFYMD